MSGEGGPARLIAWHHEMQGAHQRLRAALRVVEASLDTGCPVPPLERDLLLHCHGFCVALDGHHRAEDEVLFPGLLAAQPHLEPVVRRLEQDHAAIAHLLGELRTVLDGSAPESVVRQHVDGVGAIMESHFRYEERELLGLLADLDLDTEVTRALGPL